MEAIATLQNPVRLDFDTMHPVAVGFLPGAATWTDIQLDDAPRLDENLLAVAYIPQAPESSLGMLEYLSRILLPPVRDARLSGMRNLIDYLKLAWTEAVRRGQVAVASGVMAFDTGLVSATGDGVLAVFEANRNPNRQPWVLRKFIRRSEANPIAATRVPLPDGRAVESLLDGMPAPDLEAMRRALFPDQYRDFAQHFAFPEALETLSDRALPEPWGFCSEPQTQYRILKNYLSQTYHRLKVEDRIALSADGDLAAFNTGLVDRVQRRDLLAVYSPNPLMAGVCQIPWIFRGWTAFGDGHLGREVAIALGAEPHRAVYARTARELVLMLPADRAPVVSINHAHILGDHLERFPTVFLKELTAHSATCAEMIDTGNFKSLGQMMLSDDALNYRMRESINRAVQLSLERQRADIRFAVPCHFPSRSTMSFLLPLALSDPDRPDIAIIVEEVAEGVLVAATVLDLETAYCHARLVSRVDGGWLATAFRG